MSEPRFPDATELSRRIHARELSCRDVMQQHLQHIRELNPRFNCIVNLAPEADLLAEADARDRELADGRSRGWMHGLPHAVKDTAAAAGFPTTLGSALLSKTITREDGIMAARLRAAGCIVIGKTNVPEFGLGSHTFNELFGATRNAWDDTVSAGGSSGGAASALALGLLPCADGSDFMGSLRNPAGWNNVFGMRPSQGVVPLGPVPDVWVSQLATEGPMGRSVRDITRLLETQAGFDARAPLSSGLADIDPSDDARSAAWAAGRLDGLRVGWLRDLGGHLAMEDGVLATCEQALTRMSNAGAQVEALDSPPFDPVALWDCWLVWRQALAGARVAQMLTLGPHARALIKDEALWEHEQSQGLGFAQFMRASQQRSAFYQRLHDLYITRFDVMVLPTAQVWPFPVQQRWPHAIDARAMDTYHRWMECTIYATLAGLPAISVPAGFDLSGRWPMGLQLIGGYRRDRVLLRIAAGYERSIGDLLARRPALQQGNAH